MSLTPKPWKVVRSATCGHLRAEHNYREDPREEWTDDDIVLIEAAPEMLAALEEVVKANEYSGSRLVGAEYDAMQAVKVAIKKARGQ